MVVPVEAGDTFQKGTPRSLFSMERYYQGPSISWDISLDGQRFLMLTRSDASDASHFIVVQNWHEELSRLVPVD